MFKKMVIKEMAKKFSIKDLTEYLEIIPIEDENLEVINFVKDIIKEKRVDKIEKMV